MTDTKVTYADWDDDFGHKPVEPQLLSLLARQRLDVLFSHPTPSVLSALSAHSTSLYDLGLRAGMDWRRRSDNDIPNPSNNASYRQYLMMADELRNLRADTADCRHLSYIEGWLAGWHAQALDSATTAKPSWQHSAPTNAPTKPHQVSRGAY